MCHVHIEFKWFFSFTIKFLTAENFLLPIKQWLEEMDEAS